MKRLILDLDAGTDDAVALAMLLHADSKSLVKIEAIVCSKGNTELNNVCKNVIRILEHAGRTDIPVYKGARHHLVAHDEHPGMYHGTDGFGDLQHAKQPDVSLIKKELFLSALYDLVRRNPGEITLMCLGPLTNAALLMTVHEDFPELIRDIYMMGGNYTGVGNVTEHAEFNVYCDPEAAELVLHHAKKCGIVVLPWETCTKSKMTLKWRFNSLPNASAGPVWSLVTRAEEAVYKTRIDTEMWMPCDSFLTFIYIYEDGIKEELSTQASVDLHGGVTRGRIDLKTTEGSKNRLPVRIVTAIDETLYGKVITETGLNV